ncbi:uncharacterized protein BX664DRAFT_319163 [Halteromyces radiatus]|uniref:uncharacterized protein n=1 Tax=Halteromyces radiatus TaxID=101107 RepID=UPI00221FCA34|nr:uncharacterized protein BX664DRAFT_319163 [Halteromyces radiatus]KAI8098613.1 hypothetical protein BX664DRAFT_319163 [Halteromyces radiatus]
MSYIQRFKTVSTTCRQIEWKQRCFSTCTLQKQQQYGEGFAPPQGSRDTIKPVHRRRRIATSIPSHLGNPSKATSDTTKLSPKKQYREELRSTRHQYARELLQLQGQRDAAAATKRMENEDRLQSLKHQLEQEKLEHLQHEKEVVAMLTNTNNVIASDQELKQENVRQQNRLDHEQRIRSTRLRHLIKMYHATENFVTLENLDSRIDMLLAHKDHPPMYTLAELMVTPAAEADEIKNRKELLNEAMGL